MSYERFLKDKLIKKIRPDFKQIAAYIKRAKRDLQTAEKILASDPTWSFTIIYHAMIRSGKALMYVHGFLPTSIRSHKTVVYFTKIALGEACDDLFRRFNRMRRRRHDFVYDAINNISKSEVKSSIATAKRLIEVIVAKIQELNPQLNLFE
ncbi:MAG: HEPN domain-containing protein [Chitinivibrionales bacterium]|nr:HEPN domain-containing protein [Chitinivibrionales bacterium]